MNTSYIVYYVLLGVLILFAGVSYFYKKYYFMSIFGAFAILTIILVFLVIWRENYEHYIFSLYHLFSSSQALFLLFPFPKNKDRQI